MIGGVPITMGLEFTGDITIAGRPIGAPVGRGAGFCNSDVWSLQQSAARQYLEQDLDEVG
jgi:hypothetical protein